MMSYDAAYDGDSGSQILMLNAAASSPSFYPGILFLPHCTAVFGLIWGLTAAPSFHDVEQHCDH